MLWETERAVKCLSRRGGAALCRFFGANYQEEGERERERKKKDFTSLEQIFFQLSFAHVDYPISWASGEYQSGGFSLEEVVTPFPPPPPPPPPPRCLLLQSELRAALAAWAEQEPRGR